MDRALDAAAAIVRDLAAFGGVALVGYGLWLHYPPLGFAAAGLMLFGLAVAGRMVRGMGRAAVRQDRPGP